MAERPSIGQDLPASGRQDRVPNGSAGSDLAAPFAAAGSGGGAMVAQQSINSADSETLAVGNLLRGESDVLELPQAAKAIASSGCGPASGGGTANSGLMIDGFVIPPHVLQALQVGFQHELQRRNRAPCCTAAPCC